MPIIAVVKVGCIFVESWLVEFLLSALCQAGLLGLLQGLIMPQLDTTMRRFEEAGLGKYVLPEIQKKYTLRQALRLEDSTSTTDTAENSRCVFVSYSRHILRC